MSPRSSAFLFAALALAAGATAVAAQNPAQGPLLLGTVVDSVTGLPVSEAEISLTHAHRVVLTDSAGRFAMRLARAEPDTVEVELMGYRERTIPVAIGPGITNLNVTLVPRPVILKGVTAVARDLRQRQHWTFNSRTYYRRDLITASGYDLYTFLHNRGAYVPERTEVYFDGFRMTRGFEGIPHYPLSDIYAVQVVNRLKAGVFVYVYTSWYIDWLARYGGRLAWQ